MNYRSIILYSRSIWWMTRWTWHQHKITHTHTQLPPQSIIGFWTFLIRSNFSNEKETNKQCSCTPNVLRQINSSHNRHTCYYILGSKCSRKSYWHNYEKKIKIAEFAYPPIGVHKMRCNGICRRNRYVRRPLSAYWPHRPTVLSNYSVVMKTFCVDCRGTTCWR